MESTDHFCTAAGALAAAATPRTALYAQLAEAIAASIQVATLADMMRALMRKAAA